MIRQTVLPFKLERTEEGITARSGLVVYAEFMRAMGVDRLLDRHMPRPGSGRGFAARDYIKPLSMMLYGGGEAIEDVRELRGDEVMGELCELERVPSSSAIGDWLRRMGCRGGVLGMEGVNDGISQKVLQKDQREGYTLIIDPTFIESDKSQARLTYKGFKGYRPVVATLKELGLAIAYEFREGNDSGGKLQMVKKAFGKMPRGKRITEVLLDGEYYTHKVIDYLEGKGVRWALCVDKDASVMEVIRRIPEGEWRPFRSEDGIATDREIAETVHATHKGKGDFA